MKRLSSKLAAFLLVAVMVVSLFPAAVFAEDTDVEESDTSSTTFSAYAVAADDADGAINDNLILNENVIDGEENTESLEDLVEAIETDLEVVTPDLNADAFYGEYTVGDLKVTVSYEAGTVPAGTEVVVTDAKPEAIEAVKADAEEDINVVGADISFVFEGKEIEPKDFSDKKVTVALEYAGEEDLSGQYFETLHVNETLDENGEVVYSVEPIEATMTDIVETVTKYTEVPVYETREITEERTVMVTKTREVEKTKTVKVKVKVKWYDPSTWSGYKYETQKYKVTETYEEPVTETVVVGTEDVQVGTETVEDGTEEIVVGQTTVFEADDFSTFTMTWGSGNGNKVTIHHGYMENGAFVEFATGSSTNTNYPTFLRWSDYNNYEYAVLIYDFKDYEYSATYYRATEGVPTSGTAIWPTLRKRDQLGSNNDNWRYRNASNNSWNDNGDGACANNSHIYVLYTPKTITEGYTPSSGGDDPGTPTPAPTFTPDVGKNVSNQQTDGTYDISLGFVGNKEDNEVKTTARVIVVFDLSGSMEEDISGDMPTYFDDYWWQWRDNPDFDGTSRLTLAKNAVNKLAETLLDLEDSQGNKLVEMGLVTFATDGRIRSFGTGTNASNYTSDYATYSGVISNLPISDDGDLGTGINDIGRGTNWEKGLNLANSMTASTAGKTYIIFVSDGDPTYRVSRGNYSDSQLASERAIDNRVKTPIFGSGNSNYDGNYDTAKEVAKSIVDHNKVLYTVGLSSDATRMTNLATYAGGTYKPGDDADEFAASLADIAGAISEEVGLTDVVITDGVTSMSQVETQSLIGTAGNFEYYQSYPLVQGESGYTYVIGTQTYNITQAQVDAGTDGNNHRIYTRRASDGTTVTYIEYPWEDAPEATVNSQTNNVVWNTSSANSNLVHGVYYSVKFTVWPKQEAYDLIADLENGIVKVTDPESKLPAGKKAQLRVLVNGTTYEYDTASGTWTGGLSDAQLQALIDANDATTFSMKTNTGLSANYKYGGVEQPTATYTNYTNGDMSLDATSINIKKTWNNYLDARDATDVTLTITRTHTDDNGQKVTEDYTTIAMGEPREVTTPDDGKQWVQTPDQDLYISLGVLSVNGSDVTVREKGYDYSVEEPANFSYRWDLTADIYHPMVINGVTTVLIEVQDTTGLPESVTGLGDNKTVTADGKTYYKFGGELYVAKSGENLLEATNDRRSNLYIKKVVADETAPEDDLFPIEITIDNPNANHPQDTGYSTWYDTSWFFVSTAEDDRSTIVLDDIEVSDNVTPEISELRTDNTHITDIQTHSADDTYPYDYITYYYDGTLNTVKAVDLQQHTGTETVEVEGEQVVQQYTYYSYYTGFYWFDNGATATVSIKDGWYINFNNMGRDTEYTIVEPTEDMPDGYTLDEATSSAENTQNETVVPATISGNTATGTIDRPNSYYRVNYSNNYEGVFYVYHSSNNDVVRYPMATDGVKYYYTDAEDNKTFNIFTRTIEGTFYGGYYDDYAGKSSTFDETALEYAEDEDYDGVAATDAGEDANAYTYAYIKDSERGAWDDGTAYTDSGKAMVPERNEVYYLKEVPTYYLLPYSQYTYNKTDKVIRNIWYISAIDDLHYDKAGFFVETINADGEKEATVVDTLTVTNSSGGATVTLSPKSVFGNKGGAGNGVQAGYLGYWDAKAKIAANATSKFTPFWITPDGIYVNGDYTRTIKFNNGKVGTGGMRTTDTETESNYPTID